MHAPLSIFVGNSRDPLPQCPDGAIWRIESGETDIMVLARGEAGDVVSRGMIGIAGTGSLIPDCRGGQVGIEMIPLEGATLAAIPTIGLDAEAWDNGLGQWWQALALGIERMGLPRPQIAFLAEDDEDGGGFDVAEGDAIAAHARLAWVESIAGLRLFDQPGGGSDLPVPIGAHMWCRATRAARLDFLTTAQLEERGILEAAAAAANGLIFALAAILLNSNLVDGQRRQAERWTRESDSFEHLMAAAVESLDGRRLPRKGADTVTDLQKACRRVARWHGIDFKDEVADSGWDEMGVRLRKLALASRFQIRQVALAGNWWTNDVPALLAFDHATGDPVAVIPAGSNRIELYRGGESEARLLTSRSAAELDGHGYVFHAPFPDRAKTLADIWRFSAIDRSVILSLVGLVLATSLLGVLPPMIVKVLFGSAITSADFPLIVDLSLALLVIQGTSILVTLSYDAALLSLEGRTMPRLQAAVFDRVLRLSGKMLVAMPLGKIHSKWMLFEKLPGSGVMRLVITSTLTCALSICSLVVMFVYFPLLATLVLALTLGLIGLATRTGPRQMDDMGKGAALDGHYWSIVTEALRGIRKLRLSGAEGLLFNRWFTFLVERRVRFLQGFRHRQRLLSVLSVFEGLILLTILVVISFQFSGQSLPMGQFMAFLTATKTFTHAVAMFSATLPDFHLLAKDDLPDVMPFLAAEVENPGQKQTPTELQGGIEIAKVAFRYEGAIRPALNGITIEAQPGEFIAVTGPSGCGKSTLLKLLLGIEQPTSGAVFYDGCNLNQMDVVAVRSQIGVVMQSASLIPGTIFDFISAGRPLTLAKAWTAARQAGIDQRISTLPMGMFTIISESGSALSGGEMQRLMIARAIAGNPRILLFDEATSWLDNHTQRKVIESLSRLHITRVVIAHRLMTLQQADRIYVIDKGEVIEIGTFSELVEAGGLFSTLIKYQMP